MELNLEVVLTSSIKRKKPWPRFCWLGKEKESVFLLDDKRISEIDMVSGRTKKKTPKLQPLLSTVVAMTSSRDGMWLCGLLASGELFLWNRDKDLLKTAATAPDVAHVITDDQGNTTRLSLQVSGDGRRVLLVAVTGHVFLWECVDHRELAGVRDSAVKGRWAHISPHEDSLLPCPQDKEATQCTIFVRTEVMGEACLSAFVFTSGKKLIITCLKIQWEEGHMRVGSVGYSIQWATKTYPMSRLTPPCQPVKSRGALVPAFSPDGHILAIALNQRQPKATQVLFVSTQNFVSISSGLGGCGSRKMEIPSKYIRSYWVGSASWSPDSLFLACILKRGSLLIVSRLGGHLTLTSSGCSVDFGPAQFLPLHPLVTYRPPVSAGKAELSLSSSSLSVRDVLRQRYSVTWHPRLLYLIVSDGYMATVLRVLGKPSSALLLKALLKDTTQDLEKTSRKLDKSKVDVKSWLNSVSCLNLDSSLEKFNRKTTDSVLSVATDGSTLPLFLQDQGSFGGTRELLERVQTFFEADSDLEGTPAGSHFEDGGRLEFASMFDTLHAVDTQTDTGLATSPDFEKEFVKTQRRTPGLRRELGQIQRKLLRAWAFGLSVGDTVEHRLLLKHALRCVVRLAALLLLIPSSKARMGKKTTSAPNSLQHLLRALLSFLPWDGLHSGRPRCLGLVVDFSERLIRLLLTPQPESLRTGCCQLSAHSLSTVLLVLQQVSDSLDHTYSLQRRRVWSSAENNSQLLQLWASDVHHVPLLQDEEKSSFTHQAHPVPQRPSSRLLGVWQWVYKVTQQYMKDLKSFEGCDGLEEEQHQLSVIMSQIQTALQATGEKLEEGPTLLSYPGEHLFLCGSYSKSADIWRSQICEESNKSSERSVFKEIQLCLAHLYSLLSQYQLREAQEMGDHMARLILHRAGHLNNMTSDISTAADSLPCSWLPVDLHSDAAYAVVQTLGRFMASYFTNQPLYIRPAHHVSFLPPLHLPHAVGVGRLVPLCQEEVSKAVRRQQLSEVWTVDYAQDLLLLGGLLPEAVWLAYHLRDWKTAASVSLAYTHYCTHYLDFMQLRRRELHLPTDLEPKTIFQVELECLLSSQTDSKEYRDEDDLSFTDPLEERDCDMLQVSIQEILKVAVMVGVDVMSSPLSSLLGTAKELCSFLPVLVPNGVYLPSPPLYCPQPSPNTQDPSGTAGQFAELVSRHKVSGVLRRLLLLLRSAHCCLPAAQWYITQLRRARHVLYKIKKKYSYPSATEEEKVFPEGLMKFVTRRGFFRWGPDKDGHLESDTIQTITCFRELCALCWMLHVRDQLSVSGRKYQAARYGRDGQIPAGSEVESTCIEALCWTRRFLPFSCFLNSEEILHDTLLSLMSELPPLSLVVDTLVRAFPEEEESVRVPLREKYNSLLQRLGQCKVVDGEKEEENELMMIDLQDKRRQRRKHLGRLQRHLARTELHLWEKEEEEEDRGSKHGMAMLKQLSLGTTLSTSTLTDCGFPLVCSEGETADNTSEAISPGTHSEAIARGKKAKKERKRAKKRDVQIKGIIQEENHPGDAKENEPLSLPVVGTWEFELEDDEYLNFLELFLSYVLEKDSADGADSGGEVPLLKGFSSQLRKRELHSLTFDVLTTIHRRQRDVNHLAWKHSGSIPLVFRAGSCYKPVKPVVTPEHQTSSVWTDGPVSRAGLSVSSLPGLRGDRAKGLFGIRQQRSVSSGQKMKEGLTGFESSPVRGPFPTGHQSESITFGSSTSVEAVVELQQGLDPKLEAQFPELGRLLEWMVRWADRRVLLRLHGKNRKERRGWDGRTVEEGVVIRVKASTPAILTSLSLLQRRYTALPGADHYRAQIQVPETQWTVASALQADVDKRQERESSVDTGYPGSANTPIASVDHNVEQRELSTASHTDEAEEPVMLGISLHHEQDQLMLDDQQRQSSLQQPCLDDLDVTPEKEGKISASMGLDASPRVSSGNISGNNCTPETSLKLADLDFPESAEDVSSSSALLQASLLPEPQALPTVHPGAAVHAAPSTSVPFHNTPVEPPNAQPQSAMADVPAVDSTVPNQPLSDQTSPMRHRLGEDLFRLVQNINYMSLMEVLGASFSNLQLAQQNSNLAQSHSSHPNVPPSYDANFSAQPNPLRTQTNISGAVQRETCPPHSGANNTQFNQIPECSGKICSAGCHHHITISIPSNVNERSINDQKMQPLSVQPVSPEMEFRESRRLIPPSQGLLATTDTSHNAPVLPPSNGILQSDPSAQVFGLKLLQLHHPPVLDRLAPNHPSAQVVWTPNPAPTESHQHRLKNTDQLASKKTGDEKRNGHSVPKRQLNFNPPHDPTKLVIQAVERSRAPEISLLPPALPAHIPAPMQGLRLLQFQPVQPQINMNFPKIHTPYSSRPTTVIAAPVAEAPMIKLLHIESAPKMMLPIVATSAPMTRLISPQEFKSPVIQRQNAEGDRPQLFRVDPPSTTRATTLPSSNPCKRKKRREERAGKTEVTFRPNESIIPLQEPTKESVSLEPGNVEDITPQRDADILIEFSSDSLLTGQRLLDNVMSTAAELHVFASTSKRPPECHDAFTNTDPGSPPTHVDKAVSASTIASSPKSPSTGQLPQMSQMPQDLAENLNRDGRQFISVVDLEDEGLHQDLPPRLSPGAPYGPPIQPSSPTSAQLHILATSVIRSAAVADTQSIITIPEDPPKPTTTTDVPEESPSLSHGEPNMEAERIAAFDSEICRAIKSKVTEPHAASFISPAVQFSSRLSELNTQLAALENIADCLERDFSNSKLLVNTIENLTPVLTPDVKVTGAVKKTVRLSIPLKASAPQLDLSAEPKCFEEVPENLTEETEVHRDPCIPYRKPSFHYPTSSHGQSAVPSYLATPPKTQDQLAEASGTSSLWEEENLGQTGLSDTVEILDELAEEGYLSLTDLDFSSSHSPHHNRLDQQESSWMSQRRFLPEDERRELRIWMRRKQRENLAVYHKHRESLREKEHKPFSASGPVRPVNKNQATSWRTNDEKQKIKLVEQYNQRTYEACSLVGRLPSNPATLLRSSGTEDPLLLTTRSNSAPPPGGTPGTYSISASDKRNLRSGQTQSHHRPWTAETFSEERRRRLGLDRPVTSLPRDRLSQITRRGMLSDPESHTKLHSARQREERLVTCQRKMGLSKSPSGGSPVRRGILRESIRTDEDEKVNLWEANSEKNRLLCPEESQIILAGLLDEQDDVAGAGLSDMDWLDNLSETTSSLSKIDWAAIERMAAAEEEESEEQENKIAYN